MAANEQIDSKNVCFLGGKYNWEFLGEKHFLLKIDIPLILQIETEKKERE